MTVNGSLGRDRAKQLQEELLEEGRRKAEALEEAHRLEAAVQNPPPPDRNGDDRRYRDRDGERGRGGDVPRHSDGRRDSERDRARHGYGDRDNNRRHDYDRTVGPMLEPFLTLGRLWGGAGGGRGGLAPPLP